MYQPIFGYLLCFLTYENPPSLSALDINLFETYKEENKERNYLIQINDSFHNNNKKEAKYN